VSEAVEGKRRIVVLTGRAGAGKTSVAMKLHDEHGFVRVRFAGVLKHMLVSFFMLCGLDYATAARKVDGDLKEVACPLLCGRTPRYAMQTLGTEWGRALLGPGVWTRAWQASVKAMEPNAGVVVDDCRFENEIEAARRVGDVVVVRITRAGASINGEVEQAHVSENTDLPCDFEVANDGSLDETVNKIREELRLF
jgi:ribosomal protein L35AE/L33A